MTTVHPRKDKIVAKRLPTPEVPKSKSQLLFVPSTAIEPLQEFEVVSVGPEVETMNPGQCFFTGKYVGSDIEVDGVALLVLKESDVWAVRS
jgi:co-chaperonin GroES (HSP10)